MQQSYMCLKQKVFEDREGYQLVSIRRQDIESIRLWRNAQIDVLRQKDVISEQEQQAYFSHTIWPTFIQPQPKQLLFSYLYRQTCIGYGGLTNLNWDSLRAEVSFLVDPLRAKEEQTYARDYHHFLSLLSTLAFKELGLHRLFTETFVFRQEHMHILEKFGFTREGILREHIYKHKRWYDSIMHGLLAQEFANAQ